MKRNRKTWFDYLDLRPNDEPSFGPGLLFYNLKIKGAQILKKGTGVDFFVLLKIDGTLLVDNMNKNLNINKLTY